MKLFFVFALFLFVSVVFCSRPKDLLKGQEELRLIKLNESYSKWMTSKEIHSLASQPGKKGRFVDITDDKERENLPPLKALADYPSSPSHQVLVNSIINQVISQSNLRALDVHLSSYYTRYYSSQTGLEAARWIRDTYEQYSQGRPGVEVTLFQHTWLQPSVIARIPGEGPNANEVVIIGGHIDSISSSGAAPGADDDGTGTSTVLETFRSLIEAGYTPDRTVEFHGYAAEEVGLRGSADIAQDYRNRGVNVYAMVQFDMTSYKPSNSLIGVVTDYVNSDLTSFVRMIVNSYCSVGYTNTQCGYGCSDHASWNNRGYNAAFPFESSFSSSNPYIHTSGDTVDKLDFTYGLEFVKLAVGSVVELAGVAGI